MALAVIVDHFEKAKERFLEQLKRKTFIEALFEAIIEPLNCIEAELVRLESERVFDDSVGVQLDAWGTVIGLTRIPGQSDADYLIALKGKLGQNLSEGQIEVIISTFLTLSGATKVYVFDGGGTIHIQADLVPGTQDEIDAIFKQMENTALGGVRVGYFTSLINFDDSFSFDGPDIGGGFGTITDASLGGQWGCVFTNKEKEFAFAGPDMNGGGFGTIFDPLVGGVFL